MQHSVKAIGGYFSLELPLKKEYHSQAVKLNCGKNCLEYVLQSRQYKNVYIPYYTCSIILKPFLKLNINYKFYHINQQFEIADEITLGQDEAILYTNYYGLKQQYIKLITSKYGKQLIIDNTQAFYAKPIQGIDTFYTCRKFFGVADGAYLYTDKLLDEEFEQDESYGRMTHLLKRIDLSAEEGYEDFRKADDGLGNQPIRRMSKLTQRIMQSIDYEEAAKKRRENFQYLHEALGDSNNLALQLDEDAVPMVYPYLVPSKGLRKKLIENKIFVALYWPNVLDWTKSDSTEFKLAKDILPMPIDQRYGLEDMNRIIELTKQHDS